MDNERIAMCRDACFKASAMGYIGSLEDQDGKWRMVLVALDGNRVEGEFKDNQQEAVASCSDVFLKSGINHDTSSRSGNS